MPHAPLAVGAVGAGAGPVSPPRLRFGMTGDPGIDRAQVMALARGYGAYVLEMGAAGVETVKLDARSARETLEHWPDADALSRCYTDPGNCLCSESGFIHDEEPVPPSEVPGWLTEALAARDSARMTLAACQVALTAVAGLSDEVRLSELPPDDLAREMVALYYANPAGFWMSYNGLKDDPGSAAGLDLAKRIIAAGAGGQAASPAAEGKRVAVPLLSHKQVRDSLPHVEGTRLRPRMPAPAAATGQAAQGFTVPQAPGRP